MFVIFYFIYFWWATEHFLMAFRQRKLVPRHVGFFKKNESHQMYICN